MQESGTWVGRGIPRLEDRRLTTGHGTYMADLKPVSGMWHAAILRSPYAHARIVSIDASGALAMPGIKAVVVGSDIAGLMRPFPVVAQNPPKYYPLAVGKVRYVGEPVAVVVAKNRYVAEDALQAIEVDYDPLPAVVDPYIAATDPNSPRLFEETSGNAALSRDLIFGDMEKAWKEAEILVKEQVKFNKFTCMPLETYGVIADWDQSDPGVTIWGNFQGPFSMHAVLSAGLGLPANKVRLIVPQDVGGGFGIKIPVYVYMALMAQVSRLAGVPVKWIEDRREALAGSSSGTDRVGTIELAAKKDGTILGAKYTIYDNVGAYLRAPEPGCVMRPLGNYVSGYKMYALEVDGHAVHTNKVPTGPNRGYAVGHTYHALETAVDRLAEKLGRDPLDLRLQNLIQPDEFPYTTVSGGIYDSGDYPACVRKAMDVFRYEEMRELQAKARAEGRLVGIGIGMGVDPSASNMGYMSAANTPEFRKTEMPKSGAAQATSLVMDYAGRVAITLSTAAQGQSHETVVAQIVADVLGLSPYDVSVVGGMDTGTRAWTLPSGAYSSRFASVGAGSAHMAAMKLRDKLLKIAAFQTGTPEAELELRDGAVFRKGETDPKKGWSLRRVAGAAHWNPSGLPPGMEPGLEATAYFNIDTTKPVDEQGRVNSSATYAFAADLSLVEIDPKTYEIQILRYVTSHDAGTILNENVVTGQIYGATLHGIAGALYEELVYDDNGQLLTGTLVDYLNPTFCEAPTLEITHIHVPSPLTPLGAKGVGEAGCQTVPPCIASAVNDALKPLGVRIDELPITPNKIHRLVSEAQARGGAAR